MLNFMSSTATPNRRKQPLHRGDPFRPIVSARLVGDVWGEPRSPVPLPGALVGKRKRPGILAAARPQESGNRRVMARNNENGHPFNVGIYIERCPLTWERVKGIEPSSPAWKAGALPLSYTRVAPSLSPVSVGGGRGGSNRRRSPSENRGRSPSSLDGAVDSAEHPRGGPP